MGATHPKTAKPFPRRRRDNFVKKILSCFGSVREKNLVLFKNVSLRLTKNPSWFECWWDKDFHVIKFVSLRLKKIRVDLNVDEIRISILLICVSLGSIKIRSWFGSVREKDLVLFKNVSLRLTKNPSWFGCWWEKNLVFWIFVSLDSIKIQVDIQFILPISNFS